ncbi:putative ribonuclease H-like domain-containing protein [Tanacetum coccineum]
MESIYVQMVDAAKLLVLNPREFELWKMRIKQYFSMTDYALWEVIVKGDSPPPKRTVDALPNEHQLKLNSYKNAKSLMEAIEKRFGGNKESKKTQKSLLKQQYENFNGSSSEGLDQTYDRLQKLISQLDILGETISQEDINLKAPKENRNREPVRRNVTVETTDVKALVAQDGFGYDWSDEAEEGPINFVLMAYTSSGSSSSSNSDTEVSTCSKACLKSYETLNEHYDNLTKDFNKSQLNVRAYKAGLEFVEARLDVYKKNKAVFVEDRKILKLDIMLSDNALTELRKKFEKAKKERDDLKLTLTKFENSSKNLRKLLDSKVCDKFKTGVGFDSQGFDSQGFVSQGFNSQVFDSQVNDLYKIGVGYHAVPPPYTRNFMPSKPDLVFADVDEYVVSESVTSVPAVATSEAKSSESKPKSVSEPLIEDWISDSEDENETKSKSKQRKPSFPKVEFVKPNELVKSPRESVKNVENNKQAKYPRKNSQSPRGNKRNWNNLMTRKLGSNFEFKNKACYVCGSFNHLIKDCDFYEKKMVEKPVSNNARRVNHQNSQKLSHPHPKRNFVPTVEARLDVYKKNEIVFEKDIKILKLDVMLRDNALTKLRKKFEKAKKERDDLKLTLEKFENSSKNLSKLLEIQVSDTFKTGVGFDSQVFDSQENDKYKISKGEDENETKSKSKQRKPSFAKVEFVKSNEHVKSPRESIKKVENNKQAKYLKKNSQSPRAVLMKSGLKTLNTARQNSSRAAISVNTARPINTAYPRPTVNYARPASNVFNRAHSHVRRPFNKFTTNKNNNLNEKVNIVRGNVTTVGPKVVVNDKKGNLANVVKASACWVWRPKQKVIDHGNPQLELEEKGVIDSECSRHMTGNKSYLSYYEEIDGVFVAFGGSTKGGKINGKGKISTGKLDFEDMYFVKELKFNLFSVSQMCDKKNNVLFTDTECVVLSPDFKLLDENQVLLKVPRKNNMYRSLRRRAVDCTPDLQGQGNSSVAWSGNDRSRPEWIFDIDTLTKSMNYKLVVAGNQTNGNAGTKESIDAGQAGKKTVPREEEKKHAGDQENEDSEVQNTEEPRFEDNAVDKNIVYGCEDDPNMPNLKEIVYSEDVDGVAIGTKWVYRNKKYERRIVIRNKARLVTQGYTQEEGIDYDEVFAPVCLGLKQLGFEDPEFPDRVYKVEKALYVLNQAPRACQDQYVDEILKKFGFLTIKTASTSMETSKPLMKDENVKDVNVHLYRSMIGSLMYLTSSRPNIMFVVCACARFQVTPKVSHLHAVKRIFRYLKGQPKLGLWYPKDSPFDLEAYTDGDYAGASLDRKSTTEGEVNYVKMQWITHKGWLEWSAKAAKDEIEAKVSAARLLNNARQNSSRAAISVNTARPINTAYPRPTVNYARPASNVFNRAHSHVRRPFNKFTTNKNNNLNEKVNIVRGNVTTVGPKVVVNDKKGNLANVVKASACWVWRPKQKVIDHGNPQLKLQEKGVIDSGCSRPMIGNMSYLSEYEEIDGGYVAFGGDPKGGKITGKDTICVVLSPDFKLLDESQVLLRVPRKNNMYSVDLKNVSPSGGLTCFFAKATLDESNLWHRRLGHINFKTMNKLAEAVNTACYVQNRVLVIKPYNKTPYELFHGRTPSLSFMRPFGCPVIILNTLDHLGKFDWKAEEGFFAGYSMNNKAFEVFNSRTRIVEETLHITFLENKPNVAGSGPTWLFDIDTLIKSMNYKLVVAGNQSNGNAGTKENIDAGHAGKKTVPDQEYILLPLWIQDPPFSSTSKDSPDAGFKPSGEEKKKDSEDLGNKDSEVPSTQEPRVSQEKDANVNNTNNITTVSPTVNAAGIEDKSVDENIVYGCDDNLNMPNLEEIVYSDDDEDVGAEADMTNLDIHIPVSPILTTRIHKDHLVEQIIRDIHLAPQTRRMTKNVTNHVEPKKVIQALTDQSWIKAMQDELLQFKLQQVWTLVDLPYSKRGIGTKWIYRNKKDERGIVVRNKARIEAIRLFLAYASFKDFVVYQMDAKIEEEVYVYQPPGFEDPEFPDRVYKVEKALYGPHQALRAWVKGDILLVQVYVDDIIFGSTKKVLCTEFEKLMHKKFQMSSIGELTFLLGLKVTQKDDGIFISQDKYVDEILKEFSFLTVKTASTPTETSKPLMKDENAEDVDVHLYRSMIGSLMYLTSSWHDIMFVVCACSRFQVTPKVSHLHSVKRIFRYLKGQPKLGLWYPKDSPFDLVAYTDSDYTGASLDRKSTIGGCQFLGCRLISWQCKKQTVVANSTTEAEYIAASNCYGQNPVFYSKTKHIEIRHHFIKDSTKKKFIQMVKIHTDQNVADLLTKAFDVSRFQYLITSIGMLNP